MLDNAVEIENSNNNANSKGIDNNEHDNNSNVDSNSNRSSNRTEESNTETKGNKGKGIGPKGQNSRNMGVKNIVLDTPSTTFSISASPVTEEKRLPGRPIGAVNKKMPDIREVKEGLLNLFKNSRAPAILFQMLNYKLPPGYERIYQGKELTQKQLIYLQNKMDYNFRWCVAQCIRLMPKELGIFGEIHHEHTLTGMVKRAMKSKKSKKIEEKAKEQTIDMIKEHGGVE